MPVRNVLPWQEAVYDRILTASIATAAHSHTGNGRKPISDIKTTEEASPPSSYNVKTTARRNQYRESEKNKIRVARGPGRCQANVTYVNM